MTGQPVPDPEVLLAHAGPLSRAAALAALDQAAGFMGTADYADAARLYQRVIGFDDPGVTAAAMLGFGQALLRLDDEPHAIAYWTEVTRLPETPATYPAWRELASARVRSNDLAGALAAYREAQRRAPAGDGAEIAARLGWLSKELGDSRSADRHFARSRGNLGGVSTNSITLPLIAVTVIVSLLADPSIGVIAGLGDQLSLDKAALASGQIWRLWTVALVHAPVTENPLHLLLNMYSLWIVGPIVERLYGRWRFLAVYLLAAAGGSLASFAMSPITSVGASGAIFGFIGVLVAGHYVHRPLLDRGTQAFMGQLVALIGLNLLIGLTSSSIDNWAHIGGLVTGLWLGTLLPPTGVPTLRSLWMRTGPTPGTMVAAFGDAGTRAIRTGGLVVLAGAFLVLWVMGKGVWG